MKTAILSLSALCLLLPLAAAAADRKPTGVGEDIRQELAEARDEVRTEMAKANRELESGNLDIAGRLHFGKGGRAKAALPQAEITPEGDFLIAGKAQDITLSQRRQLLVYRGQVLEIARTGMDIGQRSADAALQAMGNGSVLGLLFGAMTGSLEDRVERLVRQEIEPGVRGICRQLPGVMASQQRLAANLPQFRPYATLEQDDIDDCERDVRDEFASL